MMKPNRIYLLIFAMICFADPARAATATNTQSAGTTGIWTDNAIWNPASYPGSGAGESAFLNANLDPGFTTILKTILPNAIDSISIMNASGSTWLIVSNTFLISSILNLSTGGGLAIDGGGVVSNLSTVKMNGADSQIALRNGGALYTTSAITIGAGGTATRDRITISGRAGVTSRWDLGNAALVLTTSTTDNNNALVIDGKGVEGSAVVTNLASLSIGYQFLGTPYGVSNSVIVTNGGILHVGSGGITGGRYSRAEVVQGGQMNISGGITIATLSGSFCKMSVRDPGSLVYGQNIGITVGINGANSNLLEISNYGVVSNARVIVACTAGNGGNMLNNAMRITSGGKLYGYSAGDSFIGASEFLGSRSAYWSTGIVSGADSLWDLKNGALTVGSGGASNALWISDGATVTNGGTLGVGIGAYVGSSTYVPGTANRAVITNGGRVFCTAANIGVGVSLGYSANSNRVDVTGASSLWNLGGGNLIVGGTATYTGNVVVIDQGGMVDRVGTLTVVSNNAVELRGGTLMVSNFSYNNGFVFTVGDGVQSATLKTTAGPGNIRNGLLVNSNGVLGGKGIINAGPSGVIVTNKGAVEPGVTGVGALTNAGPFVLAAGSYARFKIATNSTAGAGWDLLVVTNGTLSLGGSIQPLMVGDYKPLFSDSFIVMSNKPAFSINGGFDNATGSGRVTAYNIDRTRVAGTFRVGISNQYVVLDNFRPHYGGVAIFVK